MPSPTVDSNKHLILYSISHFTHPLQNISIHTEQIHNTETIDCSLIMTHYIHAVCQRAIVRCYDNLKLSNFRYFILAIKIFYTICKRLGPPSAADKNRIIISAFADSSQRLPQFFQKEPVADLILQKCNEYHCQPATANHHLRTAIDPKRRRFTA
jgi:hypothetical protein